MRVGFGRSDITPRVGVELSGFGPFLCRHSIAVRDRLWARAMALELAGTRAVLVSCDLIGTSLAITRRVREIVSKATGLPGDAIMVACTHTHSGPNTGGYIGSGVPDEPYLATLPGRIARACTDAVGAVQEATLAHAEVPCEGVALNREYDVDAPPLDEVLQDAWRPARPELTDTTCHVVKAEADGRLLGFFSYFGCHPVVCCATTRSIHGDYAGVATNMLERRNPGSVGLFLQGAEGDVNTCVVHKPEQDSLLALDVVAARYANAVAAGLRQAEPLAADALAFARREVVFRRKPWGVDKLRRMLAEREERLSAAGSTDAQGDVRRDTVEAIALRRLIAAAERGESLQPPIEVQGVRIGPLALLGSPFETFQAIKNEVCAGARAPIPLVMSAVNDAVGYAPDREAAARGGYAADVVPFCCGALPFANAHEELVQALLDIDAALS